jgi:hypothetical protein
MKTASTSGRSEGRVGIGERSLSAGKPRGYSPVTPIPTDDESKYDDMYRPAAASGRLGEKYTAGSKFASKMPLSLAEESGDEGFTQGQSGRGGGDDDEEDKNEGPSGGRQVDGNLDDVRVRRVKGKRRAKRAAGTPKTPKTPKDSNAFSSKSGGKASDMSTPTTTKSWKSTPKSTGKRRKKKTANSDADADDGTGAGTGTGIGAASNDAGDSTPLSAFGSLFSLPSMLTEGIGGALSATWDSVDDALGVGDPVNTLASTVTGVFDAVDEKTLGHPKDMLSKWLGREVASSLTFMADSPRIFKHTRILFVQLFNVLKVVSVNLMKRSAAKFHDRLKEFVVVLGKPGRSVMQLIKYLDEADEFAGKVKEIAHIFRNIEDHLSRAIMYFTRFTKPNSFVYFLIGTEIRDFFYNIDVRLSTDINLLIEAVSGTPHALSVLSWNSELRLEPPPTYMPHCDLVNYREYPALNGPEFTDETPLNEGMNSTRFFCPYCTHYAHHYVLCISQRKWILWTSF